MRKERTFLPLNCLSVNTGQLPWLPKNPRQWTKEDISNTAASIVEDPDFLEDRPLLVVGNPEGGYIVFAGNIRREGCIEAGKESAPCVIYVPDTEADYETIKRRAMKDNGSYGKWDWDTLANEWDDGNLPAWGVPVWTPEKETKERKSGSRAAGSSDVSKGFKYAVKVEFDTPEEQFEFIEEMQERGLKVTAESCQ